MAVDRHSSTCYISSWLAAKGLRIDCNRRLKADNMAGEQLCLAGVVALGSNFGKFPDHREVKTLLNNSIRIKVLRCPDEDEEPVNGMHNEFLEDRNYLATRTG